MSAKGHEGGCRKSVYLVNGSLFLHHVVAPTLSYDIPACDTHEENMLAGRRSPSIQLIIVNAPGNCLGAILHLVRRGHFTCRTPAPMSPCPALPRDATCFMEHRFQVVSLVLPRCHKFASPFNLSALEHSTGSCGLLIIVTIHMWNASRPITLNQNHMRNREGVE